MMVLSLSEGLLYSVLSGKGEYGVVTEPQVQAGGFILDGISRRGVGSLCPP